MQESWEQGEDGEDVDLRDGKKFGRVEVVPVAELMCEHSLNFFGLALLDERVEYNDMLSPRKTEEIGVAMGATFRAIYFVQVLQGEFEFASQIGRAHV